MAFIPRPKAAKMFGLSVRTMQRNEEKGVYPPCVIPTKGVASYIDYELAQLEEAIKLGKSENERRELVRKMLRQRPDPPSKYQSQCPPKGGTTVSDPLQKYVDVQEARMILGMLPIDILSQEKRGVLPPRLLVSKGIKKFDVAELEQFRIAKEQGLSDAKLRTLIQELVGKRRGEGG